MRGEIWGTMGKQDNPRGWRGVSCAAPPSDDVTHFEVNHKSEPNKWLSYECSNSVCEVAGNHETPLLAKLDWEQHWHSSRLCLHFSEITIIHAIYRRSMVQQDGRVGWMDAWSDAKTTRSVWKQTQGSRNLRKLVWWSGEVVLKV